MKRSHTVFEALAGAILLGEASDAERAAYAAHAAACPHCEADIDTTRTLVGSVFATAQHSETWRPFVRDEVDGRIERRRSVSVRRIATLLSGAVAATVAFNVALAVGVHPRARQLSSPVPAGLAATSIALPAKVAGVATARHPASVAPARRVAATHERTVTRVHAAPVLAVDPATEASSPAQSSVLPAMLVTLPISSEPVERARR